MNIGIFQKEPAVIIGAIVAALALAAKFGIAISADQQLAVKDFAEAFLPLLAALFIRSNVVAPSTVIEAGTTVEKLKTTAQTEGVEMRPTVVNQDVMTPTARSFVSSSNLKALAFLCLLIPSIACGNRAAPATQPHVAAAQYGTDAMTITTAFQDVVIAYTKANGGNATTDAIMGAIRTDVIPTARELSTTLKAYDAITDPGLKQERAKDIDRVLVSLVKAYGEVSKNQGIATLASEAALASARIRELVLAVRIAIGVQVADMTPPRFVPPRLSLAA